MAEFSSKIFNYKQEDFIFEIKEPGESEFDRLIIEKWKQAEDNNILRYKLVINKEKRLSGKYNFLMQLNLDRAQNRRTPENITSIKQPFDPTRFNFTKIPEEEIIIDLSNGQGNDVIAVNVSPFAYGHVLFLSDRLKCLPQVLTKRSLAQIIQLFLLSKSPHLRAVFNGLCAYASVNHLHWHFYYLKHETLLEKIELECLADQVYILKDYPARGFCLKLSSFPDKNLENFVTKIFFIIEWLQNNEVAHNIAITRAKSLGEDFYDDVRVYIWATKISTGIKDTSAFVPAVSESFGLLCIRNKEAYETLTEEEVIKCLEEVTEPFHLLCPKLQALLN
ncbi:hypothetical protein G9C98_002790 [Cotesia typhae]|uniref:GDP-D-glucose phosphorylase 1 n=1 Tax=Cotesia typhae TaxID=2053667 RepID=A0A8J5R7R4_9HYME|nr:hypothetical protein G9C98_002790 [Cotesia typhae]